MREVSVAVTNCSGNLDLSHCYAEVLQSRCTAAGELSHCWGEVAVVATYADVLVYRLQPVADDGEVPDNALLAEDGTPILTEDGEYILVEP